MFYIRLLLVAAVLSIISWFVLKLVRKPKHIGLIFLFWVLVIVVSTGLLYAISVWFAGT